MTTQVNGPSEGGKYIDQIDPDDPEYIKQMIRPAEVKEDVQQMEERKRVSVILNSRAFRKELEEIALDQMENGPSPAGLLALQQISELLVPRGGAAFSATEATKTKPKANVIPIADIRGQETMNYTKGEKLLRCKFASLHRLIDMFGWSAGIHAYCTVRLSQDFEHFLIVPYGMLYQEVTAASLVKVDMAGEILDNGSTGLGINKPGFTLHAAIHAARPDIKCIVHLRTPATISVSSMECGILPLCTEAIALGEISRVNDYIGSLPDQEAKDKLARALGPSNKVLLLANHGIVVGGESIDEAYLLAHNTMTAVEAQLQALPIGLDRIRLPSEEAQKKAFELANQTPAAKEGGGRKWRKGELEFEGFMRHLDNAGYRTGHVYHEPITRNNQKKERINSEVEYPPVASSFSAMYEGDTDKLPPSSPLKQHFDKQKKMHKTDWLNTPNAYRKEQFDETGTPNPKTITKWVTDSSPNKAVPSPVKVVDNPNQFAPQGENPKEYKERFKAIKKEYYTDKIDAGPQSRILEGVTWEEAQKIKDGHVSGTSDSVIVVGAASKGIIQRDHQHNAVVYKTYYAPNPFDNMTEDEIEKYKQDIGQPGKTDDEGEGGPPRQGGAYQETSLDDEVDAVAAAAVAASRQSDTVNGDQLASPTKSTTSSGDGTLDERSSREGSPSKELAPGASPTKEKKKKKFRMPSFSKKKDKKEKEKK